MSEIAIFHQLPLVVVIWRRGRKLERCFLLTVGLGLGDARLMF